MRRTKCSRKCPASGACRSMLGGRGTEGCAAPEDYRTTSDTVSVTCLGLPLRADGPREMSPFQKHSLSKRL